MHFSSIEMCIGYSMIIHCVGVNLIAIQKLNKLVKAGCIQPI